MDTRANKQTKNKKQKTKKNFHSNWNSCIQRQNIRNMNIQKSNKAVRKNTFQCEGA